MTFEPVRLTTAQRAAYRSTCYRIELTRPLTLIAGTYSHELTGLLRKHGVDCALVLSAHNPFDQKKLSAASNRKRDEKFRARLDALGLAYLDAMLLPGAQPDAVQTPAAEKAGYMVLGGATALGELLLTEFEQNALLWCPTGGTPELMLHRQVRQAG